MTNTVTVSVPATTANCGAGFDSLGIACNLYNQLTLTLAPGNFLNMEVVGEGADIIPRTRQNLIVRCVEQLLTTTGDSRRGLTIKLVNNIPLSRGLGSSSAAIVSGLFAANCLVEKPLSKQELLSLATSIEGHPDNVAPALLGGCTIAYMEQGKAKCLTYQPAKHLTLVAAIPDFYLPTKKAREALPATVPFGDAVYNASRSALLVGALLTGQSDFLADALNDRLHQPYRKPLINGMQEVFDAARQAGADGAVISGAGPTLMAFVTKGEETVRAVGEAMKEAFSTVNVKAVIRLLNIDTQGVRVDKSCS